MTSCKLGRVELFLVSKVECCQYVGRSVFRSLLSTSNYEKQLIVMLSCQVHEGCVMCKHYVT